MFPLECLDDVLNCFLAFVILHSNGFVGKLVYQFSINNLESLFSLGIGDLSNFSESSLYLCFARFVGFQNSINSPVVLRGCQCPPNGSDLLLSCSYDLTLLSSRFPEAATVHHLRVAVLNQQDLIWLSELILPKLSVSR